MPIIVASARHQEAEKIALLDAGADDYLAKPFGVGELLARIRVALRHRGTTLQPATDALRARRPADRPRRLPRRARRPAAAPDADRVQAARAAGARRRPRRHAPPAARRRVGRGARPTTRTTCASTWASCAPSSRRVPSEPRHLLTETGVGYRLVDRLKRATRGAYAFLTRPRLQRVFSAATEDHEQPHAAARAWPASPSAPSASSTATSAPARCTRCKEIFEPGDAACRSTRATWSARSRRSSGA